MFEKLKNYMRHRRAQITAARRIKPGVSRNHIQSNQTDVSPQVNDDLLIAIRPVDPKTGERGEWQEVEEEGDHAE